MAALDRDLLNGKGASKDADKLARANYSDRAVAALPDGRRMGQSILDLLGEFRPDRVGIHTLRKMTKTAAIKMAMHYGQAPLVTADYSFPCDDPRISAAVKENYDQIHVPLMKIALNSWVYGNQGAIKQYEYGRLESTYENDDGNVRPVWPDEGVDPVLMATPIPLPQELTQPELTKGRFSGIRTSLARINSQDAATENSDLVPVEWSLWFAHLFEENYRNYFGESRLLPAYEPWYAYWVNWHNRNRHADQDADPALQVWYPPGSSPDGQGGKVENRDAALTAGRELRNGSTVAWPSDVYYDDQGRPSVIKKWEAAFLTGGENITAFSDLLKELEVAMFRACMVPEQTLIEAIQGTGARNVAATQAELFIMSLEIESVYLDRIFNRYLIRPFIEANFGKDAPRCEKKTTGFRSEDLTLATGLITAAFTADPNALPIKFEELLEQAGVPVYSKKEQEERDQAVQEAKQAQAEQAQNAEVGTLPGEGGAPQAADPTQVGALPGEPGGAGADPGAMMAAQDARRTRPRLYEREHIHLSSQHSSAPEWARREGARRDANVAALAERLHDVVKARYEDVFEAAADAVAGADLLALSGLSLARRGGLLGRGGVADKLVGLVKQAVNAKIAGYRAPLEDELASMYHAAGAAELMRLDLSGDSWDVGRQEVQDWAAAHAGELITTMDQTVVEQHVRPWLQQVLADPDYEADFIERAQGIPVSSVELAAQLTDRFASYPEWMAERVVRTEAAKGYNLSAADMWERVGVGEVTEFDGLGGKTGRTDPHCLARNGRRVTIEQFRKDVAGEHPNGTLGGVAVVPTDRPLVPLDRGVIYADARRSASLYAVDTDGFVLSQAQVGRLVAG